MMRKILTLLVFGAACGAGIGHAMDQRAPERRAEGPQRYMLLARGLECEITAASRTSPRAGGAMESACIAKLDLSGRPAYLVPRGDGSVDLVGRDGEPVMRFGAAEGRTHVSYEPASPLVRLVALD
jgi:hypothetical protein